MVEKWQTGCYRARDVDPRGGVGLLVGTPSGGLVDVDLDDACARAAWPLVGPSTDLRHGRKSSPESHAWYHLDDPPAQSARLHDPDRSTLIELRSTGGQTVVPPSIHPSGEAIIWHVEGEPAHVTKADLQRAVYECAAIAMVARRWPPVGARHDAALALSGLLLLGGMPTDKAVQFVEIVARVAGDEEVSERVRDVRHTSATIAAARGVTGGRQLAELIEDGEAVVARLRRWLKLSTKFAARTVAPQAVELTDFLRVEFPPRENIMDPVFPRQGLGMVHAWRGLGKTYFALSFGLTVAAAAPFLKWRVHRPWNVLYVDGEMRGVDMQERLAKLMKGIEPRPQSSAFRIITPDLQENGIPDLGTREGQQWLDAEIGDRELIILDNLSSLVRSGTDKDDDFWLPLLDWLLRLRASGRAALLIHHDGKNETQRGTSRREDHLDTVFHLKKPKDYKPADGARFVLHFEKHRGFYGTDAEPFEVALIEHEAGGLCWTSRDIEDAVTIQVARLLNDGLTVSEIVARLGIGRATVDRHKKKAIEKGLLDA